MKIFNYENGSERVYIQNSDILRLKFLDSTVARKIYENYHDTINDDNIMDFVRFDSADEVNFFKAIDWIVDYREINQLSDHILDYRISEVEAEMDFVADKYNSLPRSRVDQRTDTFINFKLLEYQKVFLSMLLELRYGDDFFDMPLVPDSEGIVFSFDKCSQYEACYTLDPNKILFYRKDGSPFTEEDNVSNLLIENLSKIVIRRKNQINNYFYDRVKVSKVFSDDNMYLIIELKALSKKKKITNLDSGRSKRLIRSGAKKR